MIESGLKILPGAAACIALAISMTTAHAQTQGSWATKAPVPASLSEVTVAGVGGKLHAVGGSVLRFTGPYHVEYDRATDEWRPPAPPPRSIEHMGCAGRHGTIDPAGRFVGGG